MDPLSLAGENARYNQLIITLTPFLLKQLVNLFLFSANSTRALCSDLLTKHTNASGFAELLRVFACGEYWNLMLQDNNGNAHTIQKIKVLSQFSPSQFSQFPTINLY